jgi:thiol:disulfide interchange protein DsbC
MNSRFISLQRAVLALWFSFFSFGHAFANPELVKAAVETWLNNRYKVEAITRTPLANMYEVRIGGDLLYVDDKAQFIFVEGQMIDLKANKNLTQERLDEINKIDWKDLPLNAALKQVFGNGKRQLVVFEDPNCPHCRTTRIAINQQKDVTVYTFTYPILAADSEAKVNKALCAKDRIKAWNNLMLDRVVPDNDGTCKNDLAKVIEAGRKLRVTGTPTLVFSNGKRVASGVSPEQLAKLLEQNSRL